MQQQSIKQGHFEGQGMVVKAQKVEPSTIKELVKELLPVSQLPEFNPNIVAPGLVDQENEGGRAPARSTGITGMSEISPSDSLGFIQAEVKDAYELTAFVVSYTVPGSKSDIASNDVRVYFKDIALAQATIRGRKYIHMTPKGFAIECDIIRGAPTIAYNEISKATYVDGDWRRI